MAIAAISQRECLRNWRRWACRVQCSKACKSSSYREVQRLVAGDHAAAINVNATAVFNASNWRVVTEDGCVLTDQRGVPLVWPKGDA